GRWQYRRSYRIHKGFGIGWNITQPRKKIFSLATARAKFSSSSNATAEGGTSGDVRNPAVEREKDPGAREGLPKNRAGAEECGMSRIAIASGVICAMFLLLVGSPAARASIVFDDFNSNEGHFNQNPTFSGTSNVSSASTANRVTTAAFEGIGC